MPKTYAEFKAACDKIKDAGITPIYEPISDGWHHVLWFPMVGPRYEELNPGLADQLNANKVKFADNKTMLTALTAANELYKSGCFGDNALSDTVCRHRQECWPAASTPWRVAPLTEPVSIEKDYPDVKADDLRLLPDAAGRQPAGACPSGRPQQVHLLRLQAHREAKQYLAFLMQPENLQYLLDNTPDFATLDFTGLKDKWTPEQKEFLDTYPAKTIVYQDAVKYVNPQWMDMGKDIVAMFTGAMTPEDVLKNIDQRRADMAKTAKDPAWPQ